MTKLLPLPQPPPQLLHDNPKADQVPLRDMEQMKGILNLNWLGDGCDNEHPDIQLDGDRVVLAYVGKRDYF